ncbi:MAG: hypothetical protein IJ457_00615 [Clostridia bacterium]|nr:hypothetical protein [Clostridia bacterium]
MSEENKNINNESSEVEVESAAARRLRMMGISAESEENKEEIPPQKKGILPFLENFWYHYKFATIMIIAAVIIVGVGVYQYVTKITPDIYVMCSGPFYYDNTEPLMKAFTTVMDEDYNGDGEMMVNIIHTVRYNEEQIAELEKLAEASNQEFEFDHAFNAQEYERFNSEIMVGESIICIMDASLYAEVSDSGIFMSLEDALGYMPDEAADDCAIYFKDLKFAKYNRIFQKMPDDTVIAIRSRTAMQKMKGKKAEKSHRNHLEVFRNIVEFEYPEGYEE